LFLLGLVAAVATFVAIARDDLLFFFAAACILSLMFARVPDGDE
jgi:hypothetical protein